MGLLFAFLHKRPIWVIGTLLVAVIPFVLLSFITLSRQINQETSKTHAMLFTQSLEKVRGFYSSDVAFRVEHHGVLITHDYLDHDGSIPNPATFAIELGTIISNSEGISARLYSDYPFPGRTSGGLRDRFEREALRLFRSGHKDTFWSFEEVEGAESLRFAQAIKMEESCIACHNNHPESPKKDWKLGDVRGVQTVTLAVGSKTKTIRRGVIQTAAIMATLTLLGIIFLSLVITRLRKTNLATSCFVPNQFLRIIGKQDITQVKLGDNIAMEMTVLFADIRSFTALSESMLPGENFSFVNRYLKLMEPIIQEENGFVDKYMGDAIMALFEKPEHAVMAGIKMQLRLEQANRDDFFQGKSVKIGVGINTGMVMLGTVGGLNRMEGTVIGDTVNIAARLESMTKTHGSILVSQTTAEHISESSKRFVATVTLQGRSKETKVYEILWKG